MRIKSYFSKSIETAIQDARQELGSEAMLITSRRAPSEARHLGEYEVVFGLSSEPETEAAGPAFPVPKIEAPKPVAAPKPAPAKSSASSEAEDLAAQMRLLRAQLSDIRRQIGTQAVVANSRPEGAELLQYLLANELASDVAKDIVEQSLGAWTTAPPAQQTTASLRAALSGEIVSRLRITGQLAGSSQRTNKLAVFVGPAGAGKTTVLAKLAVLKCLGEQRTARILSIDTHRVGGHDLLRTYANIIGIGFTAATTLPELREAIEEFRGKEVLLIDTPGYSAGEEDTLQELAEMLSRLPNRETHLVLPACYKRADLARAAGRFDPFSPNYLLFTRLDETESTGALVSESLRLQKPISFFSTGPGIPDDLRVPNAEALVDALLDHFGAEHRSSAA